MCTLYSLGRGLLYLVAVEQELQCYKGNEFNVGGHMSMESINIKICYIRNQNYLHGWPQNSIRG